MRGLWWPYPIACFDVHLNERMLISHSEARQAIAFLFMDRATCEAPCWGDWFTVPTPALREIGMRVASEQLMAPVALGGGVELILVPQLPKGIRLLFIKGGDLVRAVHLTGGGRRRLIAAIEHARAAVRDPSLLEEVVSRLESGQ